MGWVLLLLLAACAPRLSDEGRLENGLIVVVRELAWRSESIGRAAFPRYIELFSLDEPNREALRRLGVNFEVGIVSTGGPLEVIVALEEDEASRARWVIDYNGADRSIFDDADDWFYRASARRRY